MAHAYQTSVEELLSKNKFIKDENLIEIGWVLCIPSWADVTVTPRKCIKRVLKPEEVRVAPTKKLRKQRTSTTLAPGKFAQVSVPIPRGFVLVKIKRLLFRRCPLAS